MRGCLGLKMGLGLTTKCQNQRRNFSGWCTVSVSRRWWWLHKKHEYRSKSAKFIKTQKAVQLEWGHCNVLYSNKTDLKSKNKYERKRKDGQKAAKKKEKQKGKKGKKSKVAELVWRYTSAHTAEWTRKLKAVQGNYVTNLAMYGVGFSNSSNSLNHKS